MNAHVSTEAQFRSMTGIALAEYSHQERRIRFQLKSVNHRFFELKMRAPKEFMGFEIEIRSLLKQSLGRGSVDLAIEELAHLPATTQNPKSTLFAYFTKLQKALEESHKALRSRLVPDLVRVLILSRHTELWWENDNPSAQASSLTFDDIRLTLEQLAKDLDKVRLQEGKKTRDSLKNQEKALNESLNIVKSQLPTIQETWQQNMKERLAKLSQTWKLELPQDSRVYQEFLMLLEKKDVAEEVQRIESHLTFLNEYLGLGTLDLGKRMDFLAQELHREWTTLGNKIQDPWLAQRIGEAKLCIEQIREQSLNLV